MVVAAASTAGRSRCVRRRAATLGDEAEVRRLRVRLGKWLFLGEDAGSEGTAEVDRRLDRSFCGCCCSCEYDDDTDEHVEGAFCVDAASSDWAPSSVVDEEAAEAERPCWNMLMLQ